MCACNMLTVEERINITELLSALDLNDLLSLASTVTQGLLKPVTREEAIEAILQHSDNVESILYRKKVSKDLIFTYLHWKNVATESNLDKKSLIKLCINYWNEQLYQKQELESDVNEGDRISLTNNSTTGTQENIATTQQYTTVETSRMVAALLEPAQVDLLAHKFTEWFYQLLNKDFLEGSSFALGQENFWNDASLHLQLNSGREVTTEEAEGSTDVVTLLNETKQRHKLYFSPNMSAQGVKGRSEPHGMVSVMACGTLHQSAGVVVGLFEQIFYLIRDPLSNNTWKIKRTKLVLTSKMNVAAVPTLTEGELTRPLLPIENPD